MKREWKRKDLLLYAVTDRKWLRGESLYQQVKKALQGGVSFVQLREKQLSREEYVKLAREIKQLCRQYRVPFVINDDVEVALAVDADGVHVGQKDMEVRKVREILGPDKIIGVSARTVEQAVLAQKNGADYLGAGAVFGTSTKEDAAELKKETLQEICHAVTIPVVAIGGIHAQNIDCLAGSGIAGVAVVSAIFAQADITQAAKTMRQKSEKICAVYPEMTGAIFDMDGVLLDSMQVWKQAGIWYLERNARTPESGLTEVLFTKSMMDAAKYIRETYQIPKTSEEIFNGIIEVIRENYETTIPAKAGALAFVKELRERGIPVTVATSSDRVLAHAGLSRLGFLEYIDGIFTCCETGTGKEDSPAVYLEAAGSMGTLPATTWVFEDSLHAILTAKNAGFPVVGIYDLGSRHNQKQIQKESMIYLKDLRDFAGFYGRITGGACENSIDNSRK